MITYTRSSLNISSCQWLVGKEQIEDTVASCRLQVHLRESMVDYKIKKFITERRRIMVATDSAVEPVNTYLVNLSLQLAK